MKKFIWMCLSLSLWVFSALASEDFTKGVLLSTVPINSSSLTTAQLSELSSAAIEKGLKDTQLLAKPHWDEKNRVMTLNWHSLSKTVNGTDHSKALTEPLTTQLKLPEGVEQIAVGQEVTLKGDLDSMLEDFDQLLAEAEQTTEIDSEESIDASTTNEAEDFSGSSSGSGSGSSGGGFLSEGGLSQNQDLEDLEVKVDKITSTAEKCSTNVDWSTMSVFQQERIIKTSTETGEIVEQGECYNVGQANKIEKDFSDSCSIQINGLKDYAAGFVYYTYIDGNRVDLSGCRYDAEDSKQLTVSNDFEACSLDLAEVNMAESTYYRAAVKYSMIDGTRYNLSECQIIPDSVTSLPTKIESCDILHTVNEETSYKMQRVDTYDPTNSKLLKTGDCEKSQSFPMLKDYEAGCTIQFSDSTYLKGFKYYANIDNERHDISSCTYQEADTQTLDIIKDFDSCNISESILDTEEGTYKRPYVKFTLIDGQRHELSGCVTSDEVVDTLPTKVEVCELNHSIEDMKTYRMERVDTYDPTSKNVVKEGVCYSIEEIAIQRDFDAGCTIQINENDTFLRGFKYFSTVDGKRHELSACEYEADDSQQATVFQDFGACSSDDAILNIEQGTYQPAFVRYTLIDGTRYDLSPCTNSLENIETLPVRIESCELEHSNNQLKSFIKERIDTYDPDNKRVIKEGDCYVTEEIEYQKDYQAGCSIRFNDDATHQRGFHWFSIVDGKRYTHSSCEYDDNEKLTTNELKDLDSCSLDKAIVNVDLGIYNPAYTRYALVDGKRYELSECETSVDVQANLPVRKEVCEFEHSIPEMTTYRMERVDIYNPQDKERLREGECYPIEEISIQRDFDSGCSIQVNGTFGTYTRGFKYFSNVDGNQYILSECEYEADDSESFEVFKDYSQCSLDLAVVDLSNNKYQIPFVKYTLIDGTRYDLSGCETAPDDLRPLPTRVEQCVANYDFVTNTAHDMERVDVYNPNNIALLKEGDCYSIAQFDIERDYDVYSCVNLPDYASGKIALGYRNYIMRDSQKEWVSECTLDLESRRDIFQEIDNCQATENLSSALATLNKKWYWIKDDGSKDHITDCTSSDETYPIVTTENTCSPTLIASTNKVVIQYRKGWQDGNSIWHYVTECSPSSDEREVKVEVCNSPKYEHDFVGGQSYLRTRTYYEHNGSNVYITACGRDSSVSYPHFTSTAGCTVQHDNGNLRSQVFSKTLANLDEGEIVLKECEAQNQHIPYQFTGKSINTKTKVAVDRGTNSNYYGTIRTVCDNAGASITNTWGKGYSFSPSSGTAAPIVNYRTDRIPNSCANCSNPGHTTVSYFEARAYITANAKEWRRSDGSIYKQYITYLCSNN